MSEVRVNVDETGFRLKMEDLLRKTPEFPRSWLQEGSLIVQGFAQNEAPVRSGELRDSIVVNWRSELEVEVEATAPHAKFVAGGTRPHEIKAAPGSVLAFVVGGETVFATRVMHPGTAPNPFMQRAKERAFAPLRDLASRLLQQLTGGR